MNAASADVAPASEPERREAEYLPRRVRTVATVFVATAVSVGAQRFLFGHANNTYHIPIVLDLRSLPQFETDAFYATLDRFASAVYPLLGTVATESNVALVFFTAHLVTRALTLWVLLALLQMVFRPSTAAAGLYLVSLAIAPSLLGVSPIGRHDLMPIYFTHSSLVLPLATASFLVAARGHNTRAGVLGGLTFCVNAFAGVWTALALAAAVLASKQGRSAKEALRDLTITATAFVVVSAPVIWWMLSSGAIGPHSNPHFDYRDYIRSYYPAHTWIAGRSREAYVLFAQVVGLAAVAFAVCRAYRSIAAACAMCGLIFIAGAALPHLTAERMFINLFPLRVDSLLIYTGIGMLLPAVLVLVDGRDELDASGNLPAVARTSGSARSIEWSTRALPSFALTILAIATSSFVTIAALLSWFLFRRQREGLALAAGLAGVLPLLFLPANLSSPPLLSALFAFVMALGLVLLTRRDTHPRPYGIVAILVVDLLLDGRALAAAAGVLLAISLYATRPGTRSTGNALRRDPSHAPRMPHSYAVLVLCALLALCVVRSARRQLQHWQFLSGVRAPQVAAAAWARSNTAPTATFLVPADWGDFQWRSRRRVWVDWKQGAAVMWAPGFHAIWQPRHSAVSGLRSADDFLQYGCSRNIDYIVIPGGVEPEPTGVFRTAGWSVVEGSRVCRR